MVNKMTNKKPKQFSLTKELVWTEWTKTSKDISREKLYEYFGEFFIRIRKKQGFIIDNPGYIFLASPVIFISSIILASSIAGHPLIYILCFEFYMRGKFPI